MKHQISQTESQIDYQARFSASEKQFIDTLSDSLILLRSPVQRLAWEWAEENRVFPASNAEAGPYRSNRTPWVRGPCRAVREPETDFVDMVCGSQMAKTDGFILNVMGHIADEDPWPQLYIGPTRDSVESVSKDRFNSMVSSVESLDRGLKKGVQNKTVEKYINGARIGFAWAGSATQLASHPVYIAFIDERDRMGAIVGEGSVDGLAEARLATYNGILVRTSTPLLGDIEMSDNDNELNFWQIADDEDLSSPIWRHFQQGSMHHFAIPCSDCGDYFIPFSGLLVYDEDLTPQKIFYDTYLGCPSCGVLQSNKTKESQCSRGVYVAPNQTIEETNWDKEDTHAIVSGQRVLYGDYLEVTDSLQHVSFWISGLLSPWRTYGHRARSLASAKKNGERDDEQTAINTGYGECYMPKGDIPEWRALRNNAQRYKKGEVPNGVIALVAGVDVQKDRLYYSIDGIGVNFDNFTVDYGEIFGQTKDDYVWHELARLLESQYDGLTIHCMLVDSGYNPSDGPSDESIIYDFCFNNPRAYAAKGHDYRTRAYSSSKINVSIEGKTIDDGLQLWHLDTDYFKSMLYKRMDWEGDKKGALHFPENVDDEYLRQITAETRLVKANGKAEWRSIRRDNHWGDCKMMALAAAHIIGAHRFKDGMEPSKRGEGPTNKQRGGGRTLSKGLRR